MSYLRPASITIAILALGCAQQETAPPRVPLAPLSVDDSALCGRALPRCSINRPSVHAAAQQFLR